MVSKRKTKANHSFIPMFLSNKQFSSSTFKNNYLVTIISYFVSHLVLLSLLNSFNYVLSFLDEADWILLVFHELIRESS